MISNYHYFQMKHRIYTYVQIHIYSKMIKKKN